MICDALKDRIAHFVRSFDLTSLNPLIGVAGGGCRFYAVIGSTILQELGHSPVIRCGSLLYRAGPNHGNDTILFGDPVSHIGRIGDDGYLWGHAWIELDGDVVDFSTGDWRHVYDLDSLHSGHPPINWQAEPPAYLWRPRSSLSKWKSKGVPKLGGFWYGPWSGPIPDLLDDERELGEDLRPIAREFARQLDDKVVLQEVEL